MSELNKAASSTDRHPAVVQGQENLTGVKSVEIKRALKKNSDSEYVVNESIRTEMLYDTVDQAKEAYNNIQDAKEEAVFEEDTDKKENNSENSPTAEASYAFGMSVLANQETLGFEAILDEKTPIPTNVDQPLKEHDVEQYTGPAGYATMVQPSPGANSMVGKDPHTAAYQSQLEPNFPVSTMEHELTLGVNRELEHVSDPAKALEIAIDHLAEDKNYYTKLNTVLPEYGPEEKPERTVDISENPSAHELADKHNYEDTYKAFTEEMLGHDK